ncbi:4Fe-4S ferredoxin iron-sulfur binding domain protein [Thermocrinis albus DSM 14484]|uniref:NADH-quinone oxidoreductase subunit I n=1 Tax=Thermocrinis albus (strain DSM 14484 / JCM 11386 / HI 11/12) TaxID=638303 RepID=D3SM66_THEAH|nr:NADH-quinone oxidoreductase subunit I [Thermocrinis albus]ADC89846.1 4Fe-4S ferredoxin iron-sulfur binding domain protein [Thermocrinis albus DSM 14484]
MIRKVFEKPLTWLERILFLDFIRGLSITIRHAFRRTITTHYPYEKLTPPKRFRGFFGHKVVDGREPQPAFDEWVERFKIEVVPGRSRCVVCLLCKRACPVPQLFEIEGEKLPNGKRRVSVFNMNMMLCTFCGFCVDACPVDCLFQSDIHETASYSRKDAVLDLETLERIGRDWQRRRENEPDRIWIDDEQRMKLWYENQLKLPEVKEN